MIVVLDGDAPRLFERIAATRARGDAVLIADPRWSADQRAGAKRVASEIRETDATAWATLTSGSSGTPRIVRRTAASWTDSFAAVSALLDAGDDDVVALPAPASSSLTLSSLAHALEGGPRPALGRDPSATCLHATPEGLRAALDDGSVPRLRAALGHPWGASGAVAVVRLFSRLIRAGTPAGTPGLAAASAGGGLGVAAVLEVVR